MKKDRSVLLHACYGLAGLAAAIGLPSAFDSITGLTSALTGMVVFLGGTVIHEMTMRNAWQRKTERQIKALKRAHDDLRGEIYGLRDDTMSILKALNMRAKAQVKSQSEAQEKAESGTRKVQAVEASAVDKNHVPSPGEGPSVLYVENKNRSQRGVKWFNFSSKRQRSQVNAPTINVDYSRNSKNPASKKNTVKALAASHIQERLPASENMLDHVRKMLRENRIIHKVQPILNLATRSTVYYEGYSFVPSQDGQSLISPAGLRIDGRKDKLMRGIDAVVLSNTIEVINRLLDYDGSMSRFFINITPGVIKSAAIFDRLITLIHDRPYLQNMIVLEISQDDIFQQNFVWSEVQELSRMGFVLSLQNVKNLQIDMDRLMLHNFRFVKIDASVVDQLGDTDNRKSELMRSFQNIRRQAMQGDIKIIVEKVEQESTAQKAMELGIRFGMGYLLGRPVAIDLIAGAGAGVDNDAPYDDDINDAPKRARG